MDPPILLIASGLFHPPLSAVVRLRRLLKREGFSFIASASMEVLKRPDLPRFSGIVLYIHQQHISDTALQRFEEFVSGGGGVLAIHSATASFKQELRYFEILGGRFSGHGPVQEIEAIPVQIFQDEAISRPAFSDIPAFTVRDELYLHSLQPNVEVQFYALDQGKQAPVVWTHLFGRGRVCYACPGHTRQPFENLYYQQVLLRGLDWVMRAENSAQRDTGHVR